MIATELRKKKFKAHWLVVTLGQHGALLLEQDENFEKIKVFYVPANTPTVVNSVIGAGYEFLTFLSCSLLAELEPHEALELANLAATFGIEKPFTSDPVSIADLKIGYKDRRKCNLLYQFQNKRETKINEILSKKEISLELEKLGENVVFNPKTRYAQSLRLLFDTLTNWQSKYDSTKRKDLVIIFGDSSSGKTCLTESFLKSAGFDTLPKNYDSITKEDIIDFLRTTGTKKAIIIDDIFESHNASKLIGLIGDPKTESTEILHKACFVLLFRVEPPVDIKNRSITNDIFRINPFEEVENLVTWILNYMKNFPRCPISISRGALSCLMRQRYVHSKSKSKGSSKSGFSEIQDIMKEISINIGGQSQIRIMHIPKRLRIIGEGDRYDIALKYC